MYLGEPQPILPNLSVEEMIHPDLAFGDEVLHPELVAHDNAADLDAGEGFQAFVDAARAL